MTEHKGNGFEPGGNVEALRVQVVTWTDGHEELSEEKEKRYDEREKRNDERFDEIKKNVETARDADTKLVNAAFASSERANTKVEETTAKHFELTNNYQRQIEKLLADMTTKVYVDGLIERVVERVEVANREIRLLREGSAEGAGAHGQELESRAQSQWSITTVIGFAALAFMGGGLVVTIISTVIGIGLYLASNK